MLNEMLRLLMEGGIHSTAELARRLGVSEDLARLMTEDLTRRGYLSVLADTCTSGCKNCSLSKTCGMIDGLPASKPPLLALTAKGRQIATSA